MDDRVLKLDQDATETSAGSRVGRDLINATVPFAKESVKLSWWHVGSTFALLTAALAGAGLAPWWPLQLLFSLLAAMLMVRAFITYHDYMHRAILPRSRTAWLLFRVYSALALTPPRSWKKSHNYHHGHVGQLASPSIGAFPLMTTQMWQEASWGERDKLPGNPTSAHGADRLHHDFLLQRHATTTDKRTRHGIGTLCWRLSVTRRSLQCCGSSAASAPSSSSCCCR